MSKLWTQQEAIELCKEIEKICPKYGCHVALTGGCLYGGSMKDLDILFYRIRQVEKVDTDGLFEALQEDLDIFVISGFGWCYKCELSPYPTDAETTKQIDCFFPEEQGGPVYGTEEEQDAKRDARADAAMLRRETHADRAWQDLGNTLRDMGNEQPEF